MRIKPKRYIITTTVKERYITYVHGRSRKTEEEIKEELIQSFVNCARPMLAEEDGKFFEYKMNVHIDSKCIDYEVEANDEDYLYLDVIKELR